MSKPALSVIGLGYVGLTTALCFANRGFKVFGVDINKEVVEEIKRGEAPFYEPGIDSLLKNALSRESFTPTTDYVDAITNTEISFVTVGTPSRADGSIELRFVEKACKNIGVCLKNKDSYHLIVIRSTVIPGTTQNLVKPTLEKHSSRKCGVDFGLCMNPEFLREGSAVHDTLHPDRLVIGEYDKRSGDVLFNLYKEFYGEDIPPIIRTNLVNAELIKYASNAFLATKISFINEIANLCQKIPEADVVTIADAMGLDKRIGRLFLNAGLGYGGSCFPKDVKAFIKFGEEKGLSLKILKAVDEVNEEQPYKAIELAKMALGSLKGKNVAVLGLSFKPKTDDMRNASSIKVVNALVKEGAHVRVYDPVSLEKARKIFGQSVTYVSSAKECILNADCAIIVTEWDEFAKLSPSFFKENMKNPLVIDGRRIYKYQEFEAQGVKLLAIGLGV